MSHSDQDATSAAELFDLLIDIGLRGIDGYEVARRIRAAVESRVLLVALAALGQERRSSEAGFDARLVKPVSHEDLTRVRGRAAGGDG